MLLLFNSHFSGERVEMELHPLIGTLPARLIASLWLSPGSHIPILCSPHRVPMEPSGSPCQPAACNAQGSVPPPHLQQLGW